MTSFAIKTPGNRPAGLLLGLVLGLFTMSGVMASDLQWERTAEKVAPAKQGSPIKASFPFSNPGPNPVTIRKVETSCSCIAAKADRATYGPAEKGTIDVVFSPGTRRGLQKKTIIVETSDQQKTILTLEVTIPDSVLIDKQQLTWKVGATPSTQSFEIKAAPGAELKVTEAQAMGAGFEASLDAPEPKRYQIRVKPVRTDAAASGVIRVKIEDPSPRTLYLKVQVSPE